MAILKVLPGLLKLRYGINSNSGYLFFSNISISDIFKKFKMNAILRLADFCQHLLSGLHPDAFPK